jgi:hypothetical protein
MNKLKSGDFIKLTGSTLKNINYYHKIGLLPKPERFRCGIPFIRSGGTQPYAFYQTLKILGAGSQAD